MNKKNVTSENSSVVQKEKERVAGDHSTKNKERFNPKNNKDWKRKIKSGQMKNSHIKKK